MTQHERIIRHLESGYTLTQAEAFMEYGIGRLSSRICELRKLGYPIKGEFITDKEDVALSQDNCWNLTKVDAMDFGSADMQHWECGGK